MPKHTSETEMTLWRVSFVEPYSTVTWVKS
jgi:hypothetical protein